MAKAKTEIEDDETSWWVRVDELSSLLKFLADTDRLDTSDFDAILRVVSKPWAWSKERAEMIARRTANDSDERQLTLLQGGA